MAKRLVLILGGARSGKSAYAQARAAEYPGPVAYVATATAGDSEMQNRIAAHRAERPSHWTTIETPLRVGQAVLAHALEGGVVLVDCLTMLTNNILMELSEPVNEKAAQLALDIEVTGLLEAFEASGAQEWLLISNEVGLGFGAALSVRANLSGYFRPGESASGTGC